MNENAEAEIMAVSDQFMESARVISLRAWLGILQFYATLIKLKSNYSSKDLLL